MDPSSSQACSRRDRSSDFKRQHVDSVHVNNMADSDSQYVFDALHEEFGSVVSDANLKSAPPLVAQSSKAKDKGKALMADAKKADLNGSQQPKKVFSPKTKPLQSRNWSATAPTPGQILVDTSPASRLWTDVWEKELPMLDVDDMDVLHVHA
ncbi:hypothetical protein L7F22_040171 [Adiantum nelumboides]|nr:hypothetical protein [Adiantum nelumboides]